MKKKPKLKINDHNDKQLLWFNGEKWLVRETCETKQKAKDLEKELNERDE
jgi:hypothetical protein